MIGACNHGGSGVEASEVPSVLVAIASYGTAQDPYLRRVLAEYRKLHLPVRIVVLTDRPKAAAGAELKVGLPSHNTYSLPFAHKPLFAENRDRFDLFIFAEDDVLITRRQIDAFLAAQRLLRDDEVGGFVRSETNSAGQRFITSIHHHFRWLPGSVVERGGEVFAELSNHHSGCFMVTRAQLRKAIESGGFLVPPHAEKYGMLETAASDLYTQCGFRRLLCVSRIQDFIVPHLPNKYYPHMGIATEELEEQLCALRDVHDRKTWQGKLFEPESRAPGFRWSKDLYERADEPLLGLLSPSARSVVSVGCGWGENELWLKRNGREVCAVPVDVVFAALVRKRGIRTVEGPLDRVIASLCGERFGAALLADCLHLVPEPVEWLRQVAGLVDPDGQVVASVPYTCSLTAWINDWRSGRRRPRAPRFQSTGVHPVTPRHLRDWCRQAGLRCVRIIPDFENHRREIMRWLGPAAASRWFFIARRDHSKP